MNIDLVSVRKSLHELIDSDDPNDDEKLNKLIKEFQDARFAKRGKIHGAVVCDMWRQNVYTDIKSIYRRIKNGDLCIYVDGVDRYMVFDNIEYYSSFLALCGAFDGPYPGIPARPNDVKQIPHYQIVLTEKKQKLIFAYGKNITSNDKLLDEVKNDIKKQIKECFGAESIIIHNDLWKSHQIIIDKIVDNINANGEYCKQLCDHIISSGADYHKNIASPPIINDYEMELSYMLPALFQDMNEVNRITKNLLGGKTFNITYNININGPINININDNTVNMGSTINWLKNNPPVNKESTSGYYKRYCTAAKDNKFKEQTIQVISKELKNLGYEIRRSGSKRSWVKQ